VQILTASGAAVCVLGGTQSTSQGGQFDYPCALECDLANRLVVLDRTNRIQVFQLQGNRFTLLTCHICELLSALPKRIRMRDDGRLALVDTESLLLL